MWFLADSLDFGHIEYNMIALLVFCFTLLGDAVTARDCACAKEAVHIRAGAGTHNTILGTAKQGDCFSYLGNLTMSSGHVWASVRYISQNGWVAVDWILFKECDNTVPVSMATGPSRVQLPGCPRIVTRAEWGAMPPSENPMPLLTQVPTYFFIHHGASHPCGNAPECAATVRGYQHFHMSPPPAGRGWWDIGYSFLVGEDGNIYEGRGWDEVGAHTKGYNDVGIALCFIGDFRTRLPNDAALGVAKQLIQCGVDNGKLSANYTLRGHRDMGNTECPGQKLYDLIRTWPHY